MILSKIRAIANGLPCILTGDFNSTPSEGLIAEVTNEKCALQWGQFMNISRQVQNGTTGLMVHIGTSLVNAGAASQEATFTGFDANDGHAILIDYILVSAGVSVVDYKVLQNGVPGKPASDHCPIVANLIVQRGDPRRFSSEY